MAETVIEEKKKQNNIYGITPEMRKEARERLERMIKEQGIKVAKTSEDLLGPKTGQTQEEIQAEVDDFLQLINESRKDTRDRLSDLAD